MNTTMSSASKTRNLLITVLLVAIAFDRLFSFGQRQSLRKIARVCYAQDRHHH